MRRYTIGFLADWLKDDYQNAILGSVRAACEEFDANLLVLAPGILGSERYFSRSRNGLYELISPASFDGLVLLVGTLANHVGLNVFSDYCERYRPLPMVSVAIEMPKVPSILVDNTEGMRAAIVHLISHHRRRQVAFVRGPAANEEAESRFAVYREVLAEYGLPFDESRTFLGDFQSHSGLDAVAQWLDRGVQFDAIVSASDFMAIGALTELRARGIEMPESVCITGFDDIEESRFVHPALATVRQPLREQGRLAVQIVLDQIAGHSVQLRHSLATEFVPRLSCGCRSHAVQSLRPRLEEPKMSSSDAEKIVDKLTELWSILDTSQDAEIARFVDHLLTEIQSSGSRHFLGRFEHLMQMLPTPHSSWQSFLTRVRELFIGSGLLDIVALGRLEERIHAGRVLLAEVSVRAQANRRFEVERWARGLSEASEALHTAFDREAIIDALATHLPALGIRSVDLVRWRLGEPTALIWASCESQEGKLVSNIKSASEFEAKQLVPRALFSEPSRATYVIEPLFVADDVMGYMVLGFGPASGQIYEGLAHQVSGAIKGLQMLQQLVEAVERREAAERARMRQELEIASAIQKSILPRRLDVKGLELTAFMRPTTEVGGDYYDVLPVDDGAWIGVGDVAGHGLGTGLMMLMIQSVVSTCCRAGMSSSPAHVVRMLNSVLYENIRERLEQDEHATFCMLRYHVDGRLVFSGAHEDLVIYRTSKSACETIATPGPWIAARKNIERSLVESETRLDEGDILVLYTDGVTEARAADGESFGVERLARIVAEHAKESLESIRDRVLEALNAFAVSLDDDVTLLFARRIRLVEAL